MMLHRVLGLGLDAYAPNFISTEEYSELLSSFDNSNSNADDLKDQEVLVQANEALLDTEGEALALFKVLKDGYSVRFPELTTFELSSFQYAKVILLLSGEEDSEDEKTENSTGLEFNKLDTSRLTSSNTGALSNATLMIISVTAATTKGRPFTFEEWQRIKSIALMLIRMERVRGVILKFIESRMERLAPNVTALVGVEVASQLIGAAGGIIQLSRIPGGNIQVIGRSGKKHLGGLSSVSIGLHSGFISNCPLVNEISLPEFKIKAQRLLSAKVAMASRVDASGDFKDGNFGKRLYDEILIKLEKLSEPPPLKTIKPLPIPDSERKKRRGGKRARKLKELYAQSETRKQKNRLAFGEVAEKEIFVGDRMEGMGMLGSGNLRTISGDSDKKLRDHLMKQVQNKSGRLNSNYNNNNNNNLKLDNISGTGGTSGGIITLNATSATSATASTSTSKYFNLNSGFKRNKD